MPHPYEDRFADVLERCNSEVTRSALPDSSLGGRELDVDMSLDSKSASLASFLFSFSSSSYVRKAFI